jgi:hypothetical protein
MRHAVPFILAAAFDSALAYDAFWNANWPNACPEQTSPSDVITKFGIKANADNAFNGNVVSTLYNHPKMMTVGYWPCIDGTSGKSVNGGIPQRGNLSQHLDKVKSDIQVRFPDADHAGLIVIDWEEWEPWLEFYPDPAPTARWSHYMNASWLHAGGDKTLAIAQWNASSLLFMAETLKVIVELRPKAKVMWSPLRPQALTPPQRSRQLKSCATLTLAPPHSSQVGYYGMINCGSDVEAHGFTCPMDVMSRHDALAPLWLAGTALFPSVYSSCQYTNGTQKIPPRCVDGSHVDKKIPLTLAETARVNTGRLPVIAFTWYTLYTGKCANAPPAGLGHCPLMRNSTDLHNEFALAKAATPALDGIIVWGSHSDVRAGTSDCATFSTYFNYTLGPLLKSLVSHE